LKRTLLLLLACLLLQACETPSEPDITQMPQGDFLEEMGLKPNQPDQVIADFSFLPFRKSQGKLFQQQGEVIFLNFWATWCVPCKKEMPDMEELATLMSKHQFRIVAISVGESPAKVENFLSQFPYSFEIGLDPKSKIAKSFGLDALPTTMIIDGQGRLRAIAVGPRQWRNDKFIGFLKELAPLKAPGV